MQPDEYSDSFYKSGICETKGRYADGHPFQYFCILKLKGASHWDKTFSSQVLQSVFYIVDEIFCWQVVAFDEFLTI